MTVTNPLPHACALYAVPVTLGLLQFSLTDSPEGDKLTARICRLKIGESTGVTTEDFSDTGLRRLRCLPPKTLTLPGSVGGHREYLLPVGNITSCLLLEHATPLRAVRTDERAVTFLLLSKHKDATLTEPGAPVPSLWQDYRRFHWHADEPQIPSALMLAVALFGTQVQIVQDRPAPDPAPVSEVNPLEPA